MPLNGTLNYITGHLRRYILTRINEPSDYALAMAVHKLNSQVARQLFEKCFRLTPFPIRQVVTNGGSEFKGEFDCLIEDSQYDPPVDLCPPG